MAGCEKKSPPTPPAEPSEQEAPGMMDSMKKAADETVQKTTETVKEGTTAVKETFTTEIDLDKAVADLKAEAAQMDIESLKEIANKYKEAMAAKEKDLKALMEKYSAVPLTEKLSEEAQALSGEIKTVTDALAALRERFQVYIDALAEKGAVLK
jgi:ABC-type transporter Mla subunit MlaD